MNRLCFTGRFQYQLCPLGPGNTSTRQEEIDFNQGFSFRDSTEESESGECSTAASAAGASESLLYLRERERERSRMALLSRIAIPLVLCHIRPSTINH